MPNHKSESIHLTRILTGSPDRVFDAWINPSLLQQWLAPKAQVDAREGGHFRLEVPKAEGVHVVTGKYQEFKQEERLVMTWVYDGPLGTEGDMEALLRIELRKHGPNTELTLQHDRLRIRLTAKQSQKVPGQQRWIDWRRFWPEYRERLRRGRTDRLS